MERHSDCAAFERARVPLPLKRALHRMRCSQNTSSALKHTRTNSGVDYSIHRFDVIASVTVVIFVFRWQIFSNVSSRFVSFECTADRIALGIGVLQDRKTGICFVESRRLVVGVVKPGGSIAAQHTGRPEAASRLGRCGMPGPKLLLLCEC